MQDLAVVRQQIDEIDNQLLELIARRVELVGEVGFIKKQMNRQVVDPKREEEKIEELSKMGEKFKLEKKVIEKIWRTFFEVSYEIEK